MHVADRARSGTVLVEFSVVRCCHWTKCCRTSTSWNKLLMTSSNDLQEFGINCLITPTLPLHWNSNCCSSHSSVSHVALHPALDAHFILLTERWCRLSVRPGYCDKTTEYEITQFLLKVAQYPNFSYDKFDKKIRRTPYTRRLKLWWSGCAISRKRWQSLGHHYSQGNDIWAFCAI